MMKIVRIFISFYTFTMRNSQPHNNALRLTYIQTQFMLLFLYIIIFTSTHKVKNKGNRKK